uniref:Uncharacterized protein n=1 Tax=Oncorhynchus tshawytscha TaxID=74940 RepID=A0AAZ3RMJ3_ONCTS
IMSSEDKSLDPSDHGPSIPLSSTGGRTPSPAPTDRRPRGRPRKDAGSGLPTPRKKGRSRGRAQVEDEDSMDGTETAEAENMQDMGELTVSLSSWKGLCVCVHGCISVPLCVLSCVFLF